MEATVESREQERQEQLDLWKLEDAAIEREWQREWTRRVIRNLNGWKAHWLHRTYFEEQSHA